MTGKKSDLSPKMYANGLEVSIDELHEALIRNDQSVIEPNSDRYLARKGISLDKDSAEYSCLAVASCTRCWRPTESNRNDTRGVYTAPCAPFTLATDAAVQTVAAPVTKIQDHTKLSEALDKYISIKSQTWAKSSRKDTIPSLKDYVGWSVTRKYGPSIVTI